MKTLSRLAILKDLAAQVGVAEEIDRRLFEAFKALSKETPDLIGQALAYHSREGGLALGFKMGIEKLRELLAKK